MAAFLGSPHWDWPGPLTRAGISDFWTFEAASLLIAALFGCFVGQERRRATA